MEPDVVDERGRVYLPNRTFPAYLKIILALVEFDEIIRIMAVYL